MNSNEADRRESKRASVLFVASIDYAGFSIPVRLHDLSGRGARLAGEPLPQAGTHIHLRRHGLSVHGRIAWRGDRQSGIEFQDSISVQELFRDVPLRQPVPAARPRRPGLKPVPLSASDEAFLERWAHSGGHNLGD